MDPNQQQLLLTSGGAKDKVYIDEVFNTYTYIGNATERTITTGIDLAGEGGLLWFKNRDNSNQSNYLNDTTTLPQTSSPWYSYPMLSNATTARGASANGLKSFNSDGFTIQTDTHCNGNGNKQVAWSFRKAPGFFDIVSYSGNSTAPRDIAHNLGCIPGMIIIKRTDAAGHWWTYHRDLDDASNPLWSRVLRLNDTDGQQDAYCLGATTHQNASTFRVGTDNSMNTSGFSYVAYLFAGGGSTAVTAKSVDFDGTGDYLTTNQSSDYAMGTGDFTVEGWFKINSGSNFGLFMNNTAGLSGSYGLSLHYYTSYGLAFYASGSKIDSNIQPPIGQWFHAALVRNSGTTSFYYNGTFIKSASDTTDYTGERFVIGGYESASYLMNGSSSNFRVVKGTAVYTSSFRPLTKPLTSITNTKLLCCNNSSVTGTTTGTVTSSGDPTVSTDSPFDDPKGYNFGEGGNGNVVKCGSYVGNTSVAPEINLGWEPQLVIFKQKDVAGNWSMFDNVRGMNAPLEDYYLYPNLENSEYTAERLEITQQGFRIDTGAGTLLNTNNGKYIYIAIRREDAFVGKPPEAGTDVFGMDTGNGTNPGPALDSTFKVDMRLLKKPADTQDWYIGTRKRDHRQMYTNSVASEVTGTYTDFTYPIGEGNTWNSNYQGWMWKRHAGFDVASYVGNNVEQRQIMHNMGIPPEMIWIKDTTSSYNWQVWHKNLTSGKHLILNSTGAETTSNTPGIGILDSVSFNIGSYVAVNQQNSEYVAYLFASVDGISKIGYYDGSDYANPINLGFTPRFFLLKNIDAGEYWPTHDTLRGFNNRLAINNANPQATTTNWVVPTASGVTLEGNHTATNRSGYRYIYYAHA